MRGRSGTAMLFLLLAACAGPSGQQPGAGDTLVSIVGTPFLIAFKIPVCVLSLVVAAPVAGASALTPGDGHELREALGAGIQQNCGPPYVVTP